MNSPFFKHFLFGTSLAVLSSLTPPQAFAMDQADEAAAGDTSSHALQDI